MDKFDYKENIYKILITLLFNGEQYENKKSSLV